MEEDIKILEELSTWDTIKLENGDKAIRNVLKELELTKESLKDKCEIADERNQLLVENQKLNKVIDEMAEFMSTDYCIPTKKEECKVSEATPKKCASCIKQYFIKKVEEQE